MNALRAVIATTLLMVPAVAMAQDVKTDFDKSYNFTGPKMYAIKIATTWGNNLGERRVLTEFDEELTGKGWKKVPEAQAELLVLLHGATDTKRSATTFYSGMGGGYGGYGYGGWGGGGMGMGTAQTMVNEYTVGTLVLDMFDSKSKNLVFRGTAEDELSDNAEKNAKKLEKASTKMFKNFPPKPAS